MLNATVEQWGVYEVVLHGPADGNPFVDRTVQAHFQFKHRIIEVAGFYDGEGTYRIRFMPDTPGRWTYSTHSNHTSLAGQSGEFVCVPAAPSNHGPVHVHDRYHFRYEDGTAYFPFGTTCYAWIHQGDELEEQTLRTLETSPFNKIRMCVFPKHYAFNENEPVYYPFEGSLERGWDFQHFNVQFFQHLEARIARLRDLGIETDLILFHPYDHWGFAKMDAQTDDFYLRYIIARLATYRNIWWSLANEFDLMREKSLEDWDRFFRILTEEDPYQHLRSIHNCHELYDHTKPWVSHVSVQSRDLSNVTRWRELYRKPIVVDECCYEGNIHYDWGNISPQEMVRRFWEGMTLGGYVGHGETYMHPLDILWWAKGGTLHGESADRIKLLRQIIEEGPHTGLGPVRIGHELAAYGIAGEYYLAYFSFYRPSFRLLTLPDDTDFTIEIIDTWDMTRTLAPGVYRGECRVELPSKSFIALCISKCVND